MKFFLLNAAAISITTFFSVTNGQEPSSQPSVMPTIAPSSQPTVTFTPSVEPSTAPSVSPVAPTTLAPVNAEPAPQITQSLPGIYCTTDNSNLASDTENLACPYEVNLVTTVVGHALNALSYQRGWLPAGAESVYPDTVTNVSSLVVAPNGTLVNQTIQVTSPLIAQCSPIDCNRNSDCAFGLLCAANNREALRARGLHVRKANCNRATSGPINSDVCFRASLLEQRLVINVRRGQELSTYEDVEEETHQYDEHNQRHRELSCGRKCDPRCQNKLGACMFLYCPGCRRRRALEEEGESQRNLQTALQVNATELAMLATSKMREVATWTNITSGDTRCLAFLQTAVCYAEAQPV